VFCWLFLFYLAQAIELSKRESNKEQKTGLKSFGLFGQGINTESVSDTLPGISILSFVGGMREESRGALRVIALGFKDLKAI